MNATASGRPPTPNEMISATPMERVLAALGDKARRKGNGSAEATCPAHDDRKASLSLSEGVDGRVLLRCHAGCNTEAILDGLGLSMRDLFPEGGRNGALHHNSNAVTGKTYTLHEIQSWASVEATYQYGPDLLKVRFQPKRFAWYRRVGQDRWMSGTDGARKPLYRQDEVEAAVQAGRAIFSLEGEKDADSARSLGVVACSSPDGASKDVARPKFPAYLREPLKGAKLVVIIADNDEAGKAHARATMDVLLPLVDEVRLIESLPGVAEHGDLSDWLAAGGTREELEVLVAQAPAFRKAQSTAPVTAPADTPWESPTPLDEHVLPPFPVDKLPSWGQTLCEAVALSLQVPVDAVAMTWMAVLAACIQGKYEVALRPDWREILALWTVVVMPSGERKSPILRLLAAPLVEWESERAASVGPDIEVATEQRKILEQRLKSAREAAASKLATKKDEDEALELVRTIATTRIPTIPRLIAQDCTPEAMVRLMEEQDGRLAVLSPEGDLFANLAGRYSATGQTSNLEAALKGYSGDLIVVDRVGRQPIRIERPALSLGLLVQPGCVQGLLQREDFRDRGFIGRPLYSLPTSLIGERVLDPPAIPEVVKEDYKASIRRLLALTPDTSNNTPRPYVLSLSTEAQSLFRDFRQGLEGRQAPGGDLSLMADWAAKLAGAVGRVAAILQCAHLGAYDKKPQGIPIDEDAMEAAIGIGRYAIAHARAIYAEMGADQQLAGAKVLLAWLRKNRTTQFRVREAHRALETRFRTVDALMPAIETLVEHGWIRTLPPSPSAPKGGRPAGPAYVVHPSLSQAA